MLHDKIKNKGIKQVIKYTYYIGGVIVFLCGFMAANFYEIKAVKECNFYGNIFVYGLMLVFMLSFFLED